MGSLQPARPDIVKGFHREIHWVGFAGAALLLLYLSRTRRQEILRAFIIFFLGLSLEVLAAPFISQPSGVARYQ